MAEAERLDDLERRLRELAESLSRQERRTPTAAEWVQFAGVVDPEHATEILRRIGLTPEEARSAREVAARWAAAQASYGASKGPSLFQRLASVGLGRRADEEEQGVLPGFSEEPAEAYMSDPGDLTDAKIAAAEARSETRFVELSGKMDRIADSIVSLAREIRDTRQEVKEGKEQAKEDNKFTRWTIGVTLIASLIAFAAALWVTQGNLLASFQAGLAVKETFAPIRPIEPK